VRWAERLLLGAMLALALFSLEAGLAHIALARDDACRAALLTLRVAPADGSGCMSELAQAATKALALGPAGILLSADLPLASWALSGAAYAMAGGACAQLAAGRGAVTYLGIHGLVQVVASFLMFIVPHVVV
jgi:hypothetical protein